MRCPACDAPNRPEATRCKDCGEKLPRKPRREDEDEPDDGGVSTIIPYKNARALTAYYLGVFGMIPILGFLLAPAALILGILGLRYANANPKARGKGHAITGIILGALSTVGHYGCVIFAIVGGLMGAMSGGH